MKTNCKTPLDVWNKVRAGESYISPAETAICLRAALKAAFPGVKFSVTSKSYSMGSSISVSWTDGPTQKQVEAIAHNYSFKGFDGSIDLAYSKDRFLSRDGTMTLATSEGTQGSGGACGETIRDPHSPDCVLVEHGAGYVHVTRDLSFGVKLDLTKSVCQKYGIEMPATFENETELERFLNTTHKDFGCGLGDWLSTLVWRESNERGELQQAA